MTARVEVGVTLPNGVPGVDGATVLEWARRAEQGPFSHISVPDRLVYANLEPMMTAAAAAAVTSTIGISLSILLSPLRPTAWVAKQVASLSVLAPGRLSMGFGIGSRKVDYEAAGVPWERRGRILDEQLEYLDRVRTPEDPEQSIGPLLGETEILIGGASPNALRRLVRYGDGYIGGGLAPKFFGFEAQAARQAWQEAGRPGQPRLVAGGWFASSTKEDDEAAARLRSYLHLGGPPPAINAGIARGREGVRERIAAYAAEGADTVGLFPLTTDIGELEWLAETVEDLAAT